MEEARNLLTVVGVDQIFEQSIALLDGTERSSYAHILATTNPRERLTLILGGASDGLPICREIARSLIAVLAVAVANVILIIQPDVVVIGGLLSAMSRDLFAELETATRKHVPALISHNTIFEQGRLVSRNSAAIGANYFFLQDYVSDAAVDLLSIARLPPNVSRSQTKKIRFGPCPFLRRADGFASLPTPFALRVVCPDADNYPIEANWPKSTLLNLKSWSDVSRQLMTPVAARHLAGHYRLGPPSCYAERRTRRVRQDGGAPNADNLFQGF